MGRDEASRYFRPPAGLRRNAADILFLIPKRRGNGCSGCDTPAATYDFLMISATKEAVDSLIAALESGHSEVLTAYLGAMAKFHSYSFGTVMVIARQKPDATNVAGLRTWNSLGRFVKRGEKGIFILAPMIGKAQRTRSHGILEGQTDVFTPSGISRLNT